MTNIVHYRYDIFISYAPAQRDWVEDWLLPRLEAAGLRVCLDTRDFDLGVPRLLSIERAVDSSRHTLLVLTPEWTGSAWHEFEALLTQTSDPVARERKLLPLLLHPCQPPGRIAQLNYADIQRPDRREAQLQRVIAAAKGELNLPAVGPPLHQLLPGTTDAHAQRNRSRMLDKVEAFWVKGVLEQSLYQIARIELAFVQSPEQVSNPWDTIIHQPSQPDEPIPPGKPIGAVFDDLLDEMLILGAPGAGKTTTLLELARDLIARARGDDQHPIPVVFNLSSWAAKRLPLKPWLVEELNQRYDVPRALAQAWVSANAVLPLLDGLDEVALEHRNACVEAINDFRATHGFVPLAVCSRLADYNALSSKLRLQGALVIRPLTTQQADEYLKQVGPPQAAVRSALHDDPALWELMDNPLLLTIVVLAYKDTAAAKLHTSGTAEERRRQLFEDYITAMFARPGRSTRTSYAQHKTIDSLAWLAGKMVEQKQPTLYLERMQPGWLHQLGRRGFALRVGFLSALVGGLAGGVLGGLAGGLAGGLSGALAGGLRGALLGGLVAGLVGGLSSYSAEIRPVETLRWSWIAAGGGRRSSLVLALTFGLVFGSVFGVVGGQVARLLGVLFFGLVAGMLFGLAGWVLGWLIGEITEGPLTSRAIANNPQLRRFVWCVIVGGLAVGLAVGLVQGLVVGVTAGLLSGAAAGLVFGPCGALAGALVFVLATGDLPTRTVDSTSMRRAARAGLAIGLLGGVGGALVGGLAGGVIGGLVGGLFFGLAGTTLGWLGSWLSGDATTEQAALHNTSLRRFARNAVSGGVMIGLVFGVGGGLAGGLRDGLIVGLIVGLAGGLGSGLLSGLVEGNISTRTVPNEGIRRSIRSAFVGGLMGGLVVGLVGGLVFGVGGGLVGGLAGGLGGGLAGGLFFGLVGGLVFGLLYGGATVLQHYTLRWLIYRSGPLPLRLVPFLDYCVEHIFLRNVGGGYIFVHRLLMEHFASLNSWQRTAEPAEA